MYRSSKQFELSSEITAERTNERANERFVREQIEKSKFLILGVVLVEFTSWRANYVIAIGRKMPDGAG